MAVSAANRNRVYDGQTTMLAVNSFSEPTDLRDHEIQWGFNVMTRGGKVATRYGFRSIFKVASGKGQGLALFTPNNGPTQLVGAVSGRIYSLPAPFDTYSIASAIQFNAQAPMVIFKEATVSKTPTTVLTPYPVLMMQDGFSRAAYTDGVISRHLDPTPNGFFSPISIGANETLMGLAMEWAGDRLWVARGRELFASDISDPLHFTENTYIAGGNSLQAIDGAIIRALKRTADAKQLIVFTDTNSTRINAGITTRANWGTTVDFIKSLFPGVGCVGPKAVTDASGELAWMSQEGMRLYNAVGESVFNAKNNVASREMERSWRVRSRQFMSQACACYHDGFTLFGMPCGDIFNRHIWVLDNSSGDLLDQQLPYSWQGVWTGIRPVEIVSGVVNGELRTFCMSQDNDAVRIWEMFREDQLDGDCDIICNVETKGNVYDGESPVSFKRYKYSSLFVNNLRGSAHLTLNYKNEFGCYTEVGDWNICAALCRASSPQCEAGSLRVLDRQTRFLKGEESKDTCSDGGSPFRSQIGTFHTMRMAWSGRLAITAVRHVAEQFQEADTGECSSPEGCLELSCCDSEPDYISCASDGPPYSYAGYYGAGGVVVSIPDTPIEPEPDPEVDLFTNLAAYWKMEEATGNSSRVDSTGNGVHLTAQFSPAQITGKLGFGCEIGTGSGFKLSRAHDASIAMNGADWMIAGWINMRLSGVPPTNIISKVSGSNGWSWSIATGAGIFTTFTVMDAAITTSQLNTQEDLWMFFALSFDTDTLTARIQLWDDLENLLEDSSGAASGPITETSAEFKFGDNYNSWVDEIGFWRNRILNTTELAFLRNSGTGRTYPFA